MEEGRALRRQTAQPDGKGGPISGAPTALFIPAGCGEETSPLLLLSLRPGRVTSPGDHQSSGVWE